MTGLRDFTPSLDGAEGPQDDALERRFGAFHLANPHVYDVLVGLARDAKSRGKKAGMALLYERARWDLFIETEGDEHKLNNSYQSRYARLIMLQEPDLAGYFEVRKLRSERGVPATRDTGAAPERPASVPTKIWLPTEGRRAFEHALLRLIADHGSATSKQALERAPGAVSGSSVAGIVNSMRSAGEITKVGDADGVALWGRGPRFYVASDP